jgi:hypothetical protein
MDKVASTPRINTFELEGGGGKDPVLPEAFQEELNRVLTEDPDFRFGVKCGLDFYGGLAQKVKQSVAIVNVEANCRAIIEGIPIYQIGPDVKQAIETRRKIANFKRGFSKSMDALKEITVREQQQLLESTLDSAHHLDPAIQALLDKILNEETNKNPCYTEGIKSAFDFYRHMPVEDQPRLKSSDLESIFENLVSSLWLDELVGETEGKLEIFKRGFCKGLGEIIKAREQVGFVIGKKAAEAYYKDPVNRDYLKELYKDRTKLRGAFNTYAIKNKLDLKFSSRIGIANGGELNFLDTKQFEECYQGFITTLGSFLDSDGEKFKVSELSVEELVKQFDEPAATVKMAKKPKMKRQKQPKIGEEKIPAVKVEKEPLKAKAKAPVEQLPQKESVVRVNQLPQKESADQKRAKMAQKRIEEFKNAENKQELLQMQKEKLARMQSHPATIKEALEIENNILEEFEKIVAKMIVPNPRRKGRYAKKDRVKQETAVSAVEITKMPLEKEGLSPIICSMLVRLGLTNKYGNPLEFNHSYSQEQIQTLKVCVLHMIKSGMLLGRDPFTLQYSEKMLMTMLPDNHYTPSSLYEPLAYGQLDVLDVLEKAGF